MDNSGFPFRGSIVQYVVDCLDGKWDDYLDTKAKLKLRIILK